MPNAKVQAEIKLAPSKPNIVEPKAVPIANPSGLIKLIHSVKECIMNCKYIKQKLNRKIYCKKINKEIKISNCSNCIYKEYRPSSVRQRADGLQKKSKRLTKLERNRTSILTNDLEHCFICGRPKEDLHEIYPGRNRLNSIKYGLILPLCREHHINMHNQLNLRLIYFKLGQKKFNEVYSDLDFVEIFGRNYI